MLGEDVNDGEDLTEGGMRKTWYSEPHLSTMLVRTPARKDIQAFRGRAAGPKNETGRPKIHRPGVHEIVRILLFGDYDHCRRRPAGFIDREQLGAARDRHRLRANVACAVGTERECGAYALAGL